MTLSILYVDDSLIAVSKPAGLPVVPDESEDLSLLELVQGWAAGEEPGQPFIGVVHRLDRPVSGVVVFARTRQAASHLSESFRKHRMRKLYWGIGEGRPQRSRGECVLWMRKNPARNTVRGTVAEAPGTQRAETAWSVLEALPGRSLLAFQPRTGRSHQLRVTARHLGVPLIGDLKYGASRALGDASIALHALVLRGPHPEGGELEVDTFPPDERVWSAAHERIARRDPLGW